MISVDSGAQPTPHFLLYLNKKSNSVKVVTLSDLDGISLTGKIDDDYYVIVGLYYNFKKVVHPLLTPLELHICSSSFYDSGFIQEHQYSSGNCDVSFSISEFVTADSFNRPQPYPLYQVPAFKNGIDYDVVLRADGSDLTMTRLIIQELQNGAFVSTMRYNHLSQPILGKYIFIAGLCFSFASESAMWKILQTNPIKINTRTNEWSIVSDNIQLEVDALDSLTRRLGISISHTEWGTSSFAVSSIFPDM